MATTTLADAIAATEPDKPARAIDRLVGLLPDDDRAQFLEMCDAPLTVWGHKRLAQILAAVTGEDVNHKTFGDWRRARGHERR